MEDEKDPPRRNAWAHGAKVGLGPVREAVEATRDTVSSTIESLKAELEKKRAVVARFGKR